MGQPIDTDEIEWMRATAEETLIDTGVVSDRATSPDGAGGRTTTWTARSTTIACNLETMTEAYRARFADMIRTPHTSVLALPIGHDVSVGDRVAVAGVTVEVYALPDVPTISALALALVERVGV